MPQRPAPAPRTELPHSSPWLVGWFYWYVCRFVRKNLHAVCVARDSLPGSIAGPLVVYMNHPAWWDPMVGAVLTKKVFAERTCYAPIDSEALRNYPFFERIGFFGVDQASRAGAAEFLATARLVLQSPGALLWLTPEGRFTDPRDAKSALRPGIAHLAAHCQGFQCGGATFLPLAVEYPFWEEKLPEALCCFGRPIETPRHAGCTKQQWNELLTEGLRDAQARLAALSIARDAAAFEVLLSGDTGVGGLYEWVRRVAAPLSGRAYRAQHGDKFTR